MADTVREKLTYKDWLAYPESKLRTELIDGRIEVSGAPTDGHQAVVIDTHALLRSWMRVHWDGVALVSPCDVPLDDQNVVQPDVVVWARERCRSRRADPMGVCPALVVEILSRGSQGQDRVERRHRYARYGIREYWIIDGKARSVEVLVLEGSSYRSASMAVGDARVVSHALPGFEAAACEFFVSLDDLSC